MNQSVLHVDRDMLVDPEHIVQPPPWAGHVPFAYWLMAQHRPAMFVELGTHTGLSYGLFCQAVAQHRLETRCYAVDTWQGDEHAGYYGDEVYEGVKAWHDPRYAGFSRLLRTTFDEALKSFDDDSIDLLHIDGLHTYDAVKHDFETWLPRLTSRGIVLFHDVAVREKDFGVWRLWEELTQQYPGVRFDHSNGLGVLFVGSESLDTPSLKDLVAQYQSDPKLLQRFYAQLGQRIEQRCRLASLSLEAEERLALAMERGDAITQLEAALMRQQQEMESQCELITRQQTGLGEQTEAITTQQAAITSLQSTIASQQSEIDTLRQAHEASKRAQENLSQANAELQRQRDLLALQQQAMTQSRSWRLTRPLRALASWLRG